MEARKLPKTRTQPFQLSLRIRHPSLDPAAISRELGIEAEHSFCAGDPRPSRSGLAPASVHTESYWLAALHGPGVPMNPALARQPLSQLAQERVGALSTRSVGWALALNAVWFFNAHAAFLRDIRSGGGTVSLLVTIVTSEAGAFSLTPEVSRIFSELGISLEFEFASL